MSTEDTKQILTLTKEIKIDVKNCQERLYEIEKLDAVQNAELKEHTRRSAANEKRLDTIENRQFSEKLFTGAMITAVIGIMEFIRRII